MVFIEKSGEIEYGGKPNRLTNGYVISSYFDAQLKMFRFLKYWNLFTENFLNENFSIES